MLCLAGAQGLFVVKKRPLQGAWTRVIACGKKRAGARLYRAGHLRLDLTRKAIALCQEERKLRAGEKGERRDRLAETVPRAWSLANAILRLDEGSSTGLPVVLKARREEKSEVRRRKWGEGLRFTSTETLNGKGPFPLSSGEGGGGIHVKEKGRRWSKFGRGGE